LIDDVRRRADADLSEEEAVHDLRVACRRLEAGTRVNRDVLSRRRRRQVRDAAKSIRRAFDQARDLEVIAAELSDVPELSEPFREAVRAEAGHHAGGARRHGRVNESLETLAEVRSDLDGDQVPATSALSTTLQEHTTAFFDELDRLLPESSDDALHLARISTKKLRYEMEIAAPVLRRLPAQVKRLKRLQDILGRHQDAAVGLQWSEALTEGDMQATAADRAALMRYYAELRRRQRRLLRRLLHGWRAGDMRGRFQRASGLKETAVVATEEAPAR
jgi:CHAD domain-containing protein